MRAATGDRGAGCGCGGAGGRAHAQAAARLGCSGRVRALPRRRACGPGVGAGEGVQVCVRRLGEPCRSGAVGPSAPAITGNLKAEQDSDNLKP